MNEVQYEEAKLMFKVHYFNETTGKLEQAYFDNGKVADLFLEMIVQRDDISKDCYGKNAWTWRVKIEK